MVRDLDLAVELEVVPTVREPDGLAMSSRNLPPGAGRARAAPSRCRARCTRPSARRRPASATPTRSRAAARAAMDGVEPEYLALVDPDSFQPVETVDGRVLVAVAARIGATRLIDNTDRPGGATRSRGADHVGGAPRCPPLPARRPRSASRSRSPSCRDARARRADRDGHGVRPPQRGRRRGGRRRHRARRRLRRQQRARLRGHGAGHGRGAAHARRRRPPRPAGRRCWSATCRSAPTRPPTSRRSRPRTGSSRRPAATPSSSRAAARWPSARARSCAPACR